MRRTALLATVALAFLVGGCADSSVRNYVRDHYPLERREGGGDDASEVYRSNRSPSTTAAEISDARVPGDRRATESGVFLRYADDMVGVVPAERGGSRIFVDDERRGYHHFYPFVGGYWGTFSGRGESFRGGGPGGGK